MPYTPVVQNEDFAKEQLRAAESARRLAEMVAVPRWAPPVIAALIFVPFLVSAIVPHHGLPVLALLVVTVVAWGLAVATVVWPRRRAGVAGFTGNTRSTVLATGICALAVVLSTFLGGGTRDMGVVSIIAGAAAALSIGWLAWRQARRSGANR